MQETRKTVAVVAQFVQFPFVMPVMLKLGSDCNFYCSDFFIQSYAKEIKRLLKNGVHVKENQEEDAAHDAYLLTDYAFHVHDNNTCLQPYQEVNEQSINALKNYFLWKKITVNKQFIYYHHTTNYSFKAPRPGYILYTSAWQFYQATQGGHYFLDADGVPQWCLYEGSEAINTGPFHYEDIFKHKARPKAELVKELQEGMRADFDLDLPIVLYMESRYNLRKEMRDFLEKLAEHANIITKEFPGPAEKFSHKRIFIYNGANSMELVKSAVDASIVGFNSGTLVSSVMTGLRTIPVYTYTTDLFYASGEDFYLENRYDPVDPKRYASIFSHFKNAPREYASERVLRYIEPIDCRDVQAVVQRIKDADYWAWYDNHVEEISNTALGQVYAKDGADRAAASIRNLLATGTLLTRDLSALNNEFCGTYNLTLPSLSTEGNQTKTP